MRVLYAALALAGLCAAATTSSQVTFYKDVLPVLQRNCQSCHRPGEAGPMSFISYESTRPWAKAIKDAVVTKKMPPWFADPHYGKFANDRSVSETDLKMLVAWADTGAKAGDATDAPKPVEWTEGWAIGKPDMVFEVPAAFNIPGSRCWWLGPTRAPRRAMRRTRRNRSSGPKDGRLENRTWCSRSRRRSTFLHRAPSIISTCGCPQASPKISTSSSPRRGRPIASAAITSSHSSASPIPSG